MAKTSLPVINTARLVLRPFLPQDAGTLYAMCNDKEIMDGHFRAPMVSVSEARKAIELFDLGAKQDTEWRWAVTKEGGAPMGFCGLARPYKGDTMGHWAAFFGYHLAREHWGNGYIAEALAPVLRFAFETRGVKRIQGWCRPSQKSSMRVMEKLGLQQEGLCRAAIYWRGQHHDMTIFSLLKTDWAAAQTPASEAPSTLGERHAVGI